jgi:hypothetical protein
MDETLLQELSRAVLLDDMRVSDGPPSADEARNGTPIADPSGQTIGWLDWAARRPGEAIIRRTAPLLSAFILFFVGVLLGGVMIVRRHMRTTRELVASEAQAQHNAMHDAMSGLPNRVHYMQRLRQGFRPASTISAWATCSSPISISTASRSSTIRWGITSATNWCGRWPCACAGPCRPPTSCRASAATNSC